MTFTREQFVTQLQEEHNFPEDVAEAVAVVLDNCGRMEISLGPELDLRTWASDPCEHYLCTGHYYLATEYIELWDSRSR